MSCVCAFIDTRRSLLLVLCFCVWFCFFFFFFSSRRRHTRYWRDWSSDVCSSDLRSRRGDRSCGRGGAQRPPGRRRAERPGVSFQLMRQSKPGGCPGSTGERREGRKAGTSGMRKLRSCVPGVPLSLKSCRFSARPLLLLAGGGGLARGEAVLQAVPGVAGGVAGVAPGQARVAAGLVPALLQVPFGAVPAAIPVFGPRLPAVLVGRSELVVAAVGGIGAVAVVLAPVGVLLRGVDRFGRPLAGQTAGHTPHGGADQDRKSTHLNSSH